jgi:NADPH:quinone reductase-like Zn-dependent oxidoreductase
LSYISCFVGVVNKYLGPRSDDDYIEKNTLVTSLIRKCAVRARYLTISKDELIVVPPGLDPGETVYVISTVLPAFEALHHGERRARRRYSNISLRNKRILITGGGNMIAKEAANMAFWSGASAVFVVDSRNSLSTCEHRDNVIVLGENPEDWLPVVQGDMDGVIDFDHRTDLGSLCAAMATNGRLVCVQPEKAQRSIERLLTTCQRWIGYSSLLAIPGATVFDFEEHTNINLQAVKVSARRSKEFPFSNIAKTDINNQIVYRCRKISLFYSSDIKFAPISINS